MTRRAWGDVLRWAREPYTQASISDALGWKRDRLARYETGLRTIGVDDLVDLLDDVARLAAWLPSQTLRLRDHGQGADAEAARRQAVARALDGAVRTIR